MSANLKLIIKKPKNLQIKKSSVVVQYPKDSLKTRPFLNRICITRKLPDHLNILSYRFKSISDI